MFLDEYMEELRSLVEAPYSGWVGAMGRPDADYVGQAYGRNSKTTPSAKGFPYEPSDDDDGHYLDATNPTAIGRDMHSGDREQGHNAPTPRDTAHTVWGKPGEKHRSGFEEASGTPINFGKSGQGQGGGTMPGGGGGRSWAGNPTRPWDEDDEEEKLSLYGKDALEGVTLSPVPNQDGPEGLEPDSQEDPDAYDFTDFPSVLLQMTGAGFGTGLGKTNPSGRGFMQGWTEDLEMLARESAWHALAQLLGFPS